MSVMAPQVRPALQSMHYPHDFRLNNLQGTYDHPLSPMKYQTFRQHVQARQLSSANNATPLPIGTSNPHSSLWTQANLTSEPVPRAEDLLRRKTPNGTLNAAYNATIAESEDLRTHASKHLLMTSSSRLADQERYIGSQRTPHPSATAIRTRLPRARPPPTTLSNISTNGWFTGYPQVDSMVGISPSGYDVMDWQHTTPHVMQPPLQSALGPTASNEHSPYGPYWPSGEYAPYRPAALTDYQKFNANSGWGTPIDQTAVGQQHRHDGSSYFHNDLNPPLHQTRVNQAGPAAGFNYVSQESSNHQENAPQHDKISFAARARFLATQNNVAQHASPPSVWDLQANTTNSVSSIPTAGVQTSAQSLNQLYGDVLSWAYSIYRDLICFIQETKRSNEKAAKELRHRGQSASKLSSARGHQSHQRQNFFPSLQITAKDFRFAATSPTDTVSSPNAWNHGTNGDASASGNPALPWNTQHDPHKDAYQAVNALNNICSQGNQDWIDGMLLNGCLSYVLKEHQNAVQWYLRILQLNPSHVEATSNLAASYAALNQKAEAEEYWKRAVRLRPTYFEAVEHLIGLLCCDKRHKEAIQVIDSVQLVLQSRAKYEAQRQSAYGNQTNFRYSHLSRDNGRLMALIHAKGNLMYNLHDQFGAAKAFEEVVLIAVNCINGGIENLINHVLTSLSMFNGNDTQQLNDREFLLLLPQEALQTAKLCFPHRGDLPGLELIESNASRRAAMSVTSNSLLSLAKIFQDGMNPNASSGFKSSYGIQEILALYYLSLSLQPSPSTANNVGILLAGIQPTTATRTFKSPDNNLPGVVAGSGISLALTYYKYGLSLDQKHAHLYTNLGSLLKDIGQLPLAVSMYEEAVKCDANFDIALANLANAVKDQGRVTDAIGFYRRAVQVNGKFAEAVCGLANALNSICEWQGRGGVMLKNGKYDSWHVGEEYKLENARYSRKPNKGWISRVVEIVENQLEEGQKWGNGVLQDKYVEDISERAGALERCRPRFASSRPSLDTVATKQLMDTWRGQKWEGAWIVWMVERVIRMIGWQWYHDKYTSGTEQPLTTYTRPKLPETLSVLGAPTVLPFHTFTLPMTAKQVRQISQRNGLRVSCSTLRSSWLPQTVFPPPPPPSPALKIGYVSSDFNNHPLAHLMQSVFGMHDTRRFTAYCYATSVSDNSLHRHQIECEAPHFVDASSWSVERLVQQIVQDGIHILINLNGYTRGARNEIFAARPAPVQMSFMGFAGSLGAEWCDYLLADETAVPTNVLRPYRRNVNVADLALSENSGGDDDWVYPENIVYTRHAFFCCDHAQSACPDPIAERAITWESEQTRRWQMRRELFPDLSPNTIILANFNQLYKIDPTTFRTWLRILDRVPNAILWLLRFPADGATNLLRTARIWSTDDITARIRFTDVAPKGQHIARACVADLFLDTNECNAHTTAADCLWSGTPLLTLPRYDWKMCSRMAAGIVAGALDLDTPGGQQARGELVAADEADYEAKAIALAHGLTYTPGSRADATPRAAGRLMALREMLWRNRWRSKLFDTRRWVADLELAYAEVWRRWVAGEGGDVWIEDLAGGRR